MTSGIPLLVGLLTKTQDPYVYMVFWAPNVGSLNLAGLAPQKGSRKFSKRCQCIPRNLQPKLKGLHKLGAGVLGRPLKSYLGVSGSL